MTSNAMHAEIQRRARRRIDIARQIKELKDEEKEFVKEDKDDGFDGKALKQCIRELEKGVDYQAGQLELELVLDTYRSALGLPTDLTEAQRRAATAAATLPDAGGDDGETDDGERGTLQ